MPYFCQKGFVHFYLILLLIVAVLFGTYLVQQQTVFQPFARVEDTDINGLSLKCTDEPGKGRFLTIDSNGCGEILSIPQRCEEEPEEGYTLQFTAPVLENGNWVTKKSDGKTISEEGMRSKMLKDPRMGALPEREKNVNKVIQDELINCNLFINYSDETDCDIEKPIIERDGKAMERMLPGETYSFVIKRGENDFSKARVYRGGVGCRVEMKVAAENTAFARQEAKGEKVASDEEPDEYEVFGKLYDPPSDEENSLTEVCGEDVGDDSAIPYYPISLGDNLKINNPKCKEKISQQTNYFEQYIEDARKKAEEAAADNNLKFENDRFVIDPEKNLSEEDRVSAEKKAKELNESLGSSIKNAERQNELCKDKTGEEAITCLEEAQEKTSAAATQAQLASISQSLKKLELILSGSEEAAGKCVKADLGITPFLEAQRLKRRDSDEEDRRLLLCAGQSDPSQLKWRVLVGGLATGESTVIEQNDGSLVTVTNSEGSDDDDRCGDADCGNDAERIWGLHGKTADATGDPSYPYTVESGTSGKSRKNAFKIYDPNKTYEDSLTGVQKTIGPYIDAAKVPKTTIRTQSIPSTSSSQSSESDLLLKQGLPSLIDSIVFEIDIHDVDVTASDNAATRFMKDYPSSKVLDTYKDSGGEFELERFWIVHNTCGQAGLNPLFCLTVWANESRAGEQTNFHQFGMVNVEKDFSTQLNSFILQYRNKYEKGRTANVEVCDTIDKITDFFLCHCGPKSNPRQKNGETVTYLCDDATKVNGDDNRLYIGTFHNIYSTLLYPDDNTTVVGNLENPWQCWYKAKSTSQRNACTP